MSKIEINTVLFNRFDSETKEMQFHLALDTYWLGDEDIVIDTNYTVIIDEPKISKIELAKKAIETLKAKQLEVSATAYKRERELQLKIDSLLALPYIEDTEVYHD